MKIILLQDVAGQGKKGDLVNASDGYARNYLFPRKLAMEATPEALRDYERREAKKRADHEKEVAAAQATAAQLRDKSVAISVKSGANGKLFGAVTSADIAAAITSQLGVVIDSKKVSADATIKAVGSYGAKVKLGHEISVVVTVEVSAT